jgi:hypothetical protein
MSVSEDEELISYAASGGGEGGGPLELLEDHSHEHTLTPISELTDRSHDQSKQAAKRNVGWTAV